MVTMDDLSTDVGAAPVVDLNALDEIPLSGAITGVPFGNGSGDPLNSGGFYAADPTGASGVGANPNVNPNPTGGWMQTAQSILSLASTGFKAFAAGSPQVGVPKPAQPGTTILPQVTTAGVGGVKWSTVAIIGGGLLVAVALIKFA